MTTAIRVKPQWHDQDKAAALARAKKEKGVVIWSAPPQVGLNVSTDRYGYWSDDPNSMLRGAERIIANCSDEAGFCG